MVVMVKKKTCIIRVFHLSQHILLVFHPVMPVGDQKTIFGGKPLKAVQHDLFLLLQGRGPTSLKSFYYPMTYRNPFAIAVSFREGFLAFYVVFHPQSLFTTFYNSYMFYLTSHSHHQTERNQGIGGSSIFSG